MINKDVYKQSTTQIIAAAGGMSAWYCVRKES